MAGALCDVSAARVAGRARGLTILGNRLRAGLSCDPLRSFTFTLRFYTVLRYRNVTLRSGRPLYA